MATNNHNATLHVNTGTPIRLSMRGSNQGIPLTPSQVGGTSNYDSLSNKPRINGVVLSGNKTSLDLGLQDALEVITIEDIDEIINGE